MILEITYHIEPHRKKRGLSAAKLAELSGVSKSQICNIEKGKQQPTVYTLCLIAAALNVKPEELYTVNIKRPL